VTSLRLEEEDRVDIRDAFAELGDELPTRWLMGNFELDIEIDKLRGGEFELDRRFVRGVIGRAWVTIPCARSPLLDVTGLLGRAGAPHFVQAVEVIDDV